MNKFLNYHQNCYKPKISAYFGTNNMIAWGCIWLFFGQDSRREEPLYKPYGLPA